MALPPQLVFAMSLVLVTPSLGSCKDIVINRLRRSSTDCAEIFYLNARSQQDPVVGFEDACFWSIQALLLMAICMLMMYKEKWHPHISVGIILRYLLRLVRY